MNSVQTSLQTVKLDPNGMAFGSEWSMQYLPAVLDRLNFAVALLDEDKNAVVVNASFATILDTADRLRLRGSKIMAISDSENRSLQAALDASRMAARNTAGVADLKIWGSRDHALIVSVSAIGDAHAADGASWPVVVSAVETEPSISIDDRFLKDVFQLTGAESLIARGLLGGDTLANIAEGKGTTFHTVRAQLKSVMHKLGVCRQSELVYLLSRCDNLLRSRPIRRKPPGRRSGQHTAPASTW